MPGRVVAFWGWKTRLAPARKPRISTPLISVMSSTTTIAVPMANATSSCRCHRRISQRASALMASSSTRDNATSTPPERIAMISVRR
jgi:hypothetical protein